MAASALVATGCASRSSVDRVHADVANLRFELSDLRQAQQTTSRDLARVMADNRPMAARTLEAAALLEETAAEVTRLRARVKALEAEARDAKVKAAGPAPVPPIAPVRPPPPPAASSPASPQRPAAGPVRSAAVPRSERARKPSTPAGSPEHTYAAALATFRAREHGQAVLDFLDFIAKHPGHPLVANAQYWIGEAYYAQRDFRQALAEFSKVPRIAPGSAKASDALLKIGLCQRQLRDEARARLTWQRLVRDFPRSDAAVKARGFLGSPAGTAQR